MAAAAETRERVIEAASRTLREGESIARFSLDTVAKVAGVTRLTVYNQFGSRRGLTAVRNTHSVHERDGTEGTGHDWVNPLPEPHLPGGKRAIEGGRKVCTAPLGSKTAQRQRMCRRHCSVFLWCGLRTDMQRQRMTYFTVVIPACKTLFATCFPPSNGLRG